MALARYDDTAVDAAGNVIPYATIEVRRDVAGRPVVPLFAGRNGTDPIGNPFQANADGTFGFHVPGGAYYIRAYTGPSQNPTMQRVRRYVPIGTAAEYDTEGLAVMLEAGTASFPTLAELEAFTPSEGVAGKVSTGDDAGYYHYDFGDEEWVFDHPLYDSLAKMTVTGGTANAIEASIDAGIADASVVAYMIKPTLTNTGPVTINGIDLLNVNGDALAAGELPAGRWVTFTPDGADYALTSDPAIDALLAQAIELSGDAVDAADRAEAAALSVIARAWFASPSSVMADNNSVISYSAGAQFLVVAGDQIETAQGYRYEVAASGATVYDYNSNPSGYHKITAGGVKLFVLQSDDGEVYVDAFAPALGGADDTAIVQMAMDVCGSNAILGLDTIKINSVYFRSGKGLRGPGSAVGSVALTGNITPFVFFNVDDATLKDVLIIADAAQTSAMIFMAATTRTITRNKVTNVQVSGNATDFSIFEFYSASGAYGNWKHVIDGVYASGVGTIVRCETAAVNSWINSLRISNVYANDFIRGVHIIATAGDGCACSLFDNWSAQTSARTQYGVKIDDVSAEGISGKNHFLDVRWFDLINGGGDAYIIGANVTDTIVSGCPVDTFTPGNFIDHGVRTNINGFTPFECFAQNGRRVDLPTFSGLSSSLSGSAAVSQGVTDIGLRTNTTITSVARLYSTNPVTGLSQSQLFNTNFGLALKMEAMLTRISSGASAVGRLQFKPTQADGNLAAAGIGVVITNYEILLESYGSVRGEITTGVIMADAQTYKVEIFHYPGERVEIWINGVYKAQLTGTAVPTGQQVCYLQASLANVTAVDVEMFVSPVRLVAAAA